MCTVHRIREVSHPKRVKVARCRSVGVSVGVWWNCVNSSCVFWTRSLQPSLSSAVWTRRLSVRRRRKNLHLVAHLLGLNEAVAVVKTQHICRKWRTELATVSILQEFRLFSLIQREAVISLA